MGLKILSCGAGMQSTALALMSCENALYGIKHPEVPIYDAIIFCDLGREPPWVYSQVNFISEACKQSGIPFFIWTPTCTKIILATSGISVCLPYLFGVLLQMAVSRFGTDIFFKEDCAMGYCMSMNNCSFCVKAERVEKVVDDLDESGFEIEQDDSGDIKGSFVYLAGLCPSGIRYLMQKSSRALKAFPAEQAAERYLKNTETGLRHLQFPSPNRSRHPRLEALQHEFC